MLTLKIVTAGLVLCVAAAPQEPPNTAPATHVTKDQIQDFIAKMAPDKIADLPIRAVDVGGYKVGVFAVVRPKNSPQDAIYHDTNMTEILYILEGSADLITGGTIPDARPPGRAGTTPAPGSKVARSGTWFRATWSSPPGERHTCGPTSKATCGTWSSARIRMGSRCG